MTISTITLAITGVSGKGGGGAGRRRGCASPPKNEGALKKWLKRLADGLKRLAGKAAETWPAIVESVVGAILSFFGKAIRFVPEHTWALIVFAAGIFGVWLMKKLLSKQAGKVKKQM